MTWLRQYGLLLRWQFLNLKTYIPVVLVIQIFIGVGTVVGYSFLLDEIDETTGKFFATGASTFNTLTANAVGGINVNIGLTADTGGFAFDTDTDNNGAGDFTVANTVTVNSGNQILTIIANDIILNTTGALNSGTAAITLLVSDGGDIGIGTTTCAGACGAAIDLTELGNITATGLTAGDSTGGSIFVVRLSLS